LYDNVLTAQKLWGSNFLFFPSHAATADARFLKPKATKGNPRISSYRGLGKKRFSNL